MLERVEFDLLDTGQLNQRKMLGPDQYRHDPVQRAELFLDRFCHDEGAAKAISKLSSDEKREISLKLTRGPRNG